MKQKGFNWKKARRRLLLGAAAVFLLTGCESRGTEKSGTEESSSQETKKEIWIEESQTQQASQATEESQTQQASQATEESQTQQASQADGESQTPFSFRDFLNTEFQFCSGAGAWRTSLTIQEDGGFWGEYYDVDMGDAGDEYPQGTCYWSRCTGEFSEPEQINDFTWQVKVEKLYLQEEPGKEEIRDQIRYISSQVYGMEDGEEFVFYLPGTPLEQLPEEFVSWVGWCLESGQEQLPFWGLYNQTEKEGFAGVKKTESGQTVRLQLEQAEKRAAQIEERLNLATTQADMNKISGQLYQFWDRELNRIWGQLKEVLGSEEMEELTRQERQWIVQRDDEIKKAGEKYEGGSIQPLAVNSKAAEITRARVYELADRLEEIDR